MEDWIELALDFGIHNTDNIGLNIICINFLTDAWLTFPSKIEESELKANNVINMLSRASKHKYTGVKSTAISNMFTLLENFGTNKN